jgi:stage V sporulation protein K
MFMNPKNKKQINDFVKYLDTYKNTFVSSSTPITPNELIHLIHATNIDYTTNNYSSPAYVGESTSYAKNGKRPLYSMPFVVNPYQMPHCNLYRDSLYKVEDYIDLVLPLHQIKTKVDIQETANTLEDLIRIVDTYKYSDKCEYNIDLKSLTNIREELVQLNNMIGMKQLKQSILEQLLYFIQELHVGITKNEKGEKIKTHEFKHTVIYGPPGTGKTEIAKIIGKMYSKIGVLEKNIFKKVTRNDLVAGYLGQTALKTKGVINECLGGVLFIDEAYSLAPNGNNDLDIYSKECIDIICESLSDHKHDLMVIIAGYEDELNNTFFSANIGLDSRFIWRFKIDDYSASELQQILLKMVNDSDWSFMNKDDVKVKWFDEKKKTFSHYGRDMEMLFTYMKVSHSKRIYGKSPEVRKKLTSEDLNDGYNTFMKHKKTKNTFDSSSALYGLYV